MTYKIEITPITIIAAVEEYVVGDAGDYVFEITYTSAAIGTNTSVNETVSEYAVEVFEIAQGEQGPAGPTGPQGPPGEDVVSNIFVYTQNSPNTDWLINHNLGRLPVSVTIYTQGGQEVEAAVNNANNNQTTVTFATPFAGSAHIL